MKRKMTINRIASLGLTVFAALLAAGAACAQEHVSIEWRFDKDGDLKGWAPSSQIADATVRGGALHGRATGNDPLIIGPVFDVPASPMARVEVCMKCTERAESELYWTETLEGKFGGFSGVKHRVYQTIGDGQEHVYRIYPCWQSVKKVVRLRVDPPSAGTFDIKWIRIVDDRRAATPKAKAWKTDDLARDWRPLGDVAELADGAGPILASPPLAINADEHAFVAVRLTASQAGTARLYAASQSAVGWESLGFPLRPDDRPHTYNVDVTGLKNWHGRIVMLGLQLPPAAQAKVESLEVASEPAGPAEVEVSYFGPSDGINRAGRPGSVTLNLRNLGGQIAGNVAATLTAGPEAKVVDAARKTVNRLSIYSPESLQWQVQAAAPGKVDLTVQVEAPGQSPITSKTSIELTTAPTVARSNYVPEPQPVKCDYELGAYYFPGWHTAARWQPIRDFPNRKPVLGWYDEANPECADWQIKWAVEHGIKFFMLDWYWNKGNQHLEHWITNAYGKARYRKYLQWAVMWANHNPPGSHSPEDWRRVTQYWIDNFFGMPEYYRIDGRPAVFIWSPVGIRRDVGGVEPAAKLYALSQEMAKAAGYKGIYFVGVNNHESAELYAQMRAEGYEAATTYHGFNLARKLAGSDRFTYDKVVETAEATWQEEEANGKGLAYFPIIDTGWDARPWHGEKTIVVSGRTPQLLGELCRKARAYADRTKKRILAIGPMNEWGEGSYIEPYAEYGFQDLDQIRAAFCEPSSKWPPNLIPADVGRGPYDLPPDVPKTAWEFNADGDLEGWTSNDQVADLKVSGGALNGRSTGNDPVLIVGNRLRLEADRYHHLRFRLKADAKGQVEIYWSTGVVKMSGQTRIAIDIPGDGQFHDYEVDLGKHPLWRGLITQFRLDPAVAANVHFALDYVRLAE